LPNKFARNVARHIYPGNQINNLVITDDGKLTKQSIQAGRTAMPKNVVDVIVFFCSGKLIYDNYNHRFRSIIDHDNKRKNKSDPNNIVRILGRLVRILVCSPESVWI